MLNGSLNLSVLQETTDQHSESHRVPLITTLRKWLIDLQGVVPAGFFCIALVVLGLLIADAVTEQSRRSDVVWLRSSLSVMECNAQIANVSMELPLNNPPLSNFMLRSKLDLCIEELKGLGMSAEGGYFEQLQAMSDGLRSSSTSTVLPQTVAQLLFSVSVQTADRYFTKHESYTRRLLRLSAEWYVTAHRVATNQTFFYQTLDDKKRLFLPATASDAISAVGRSPMCFPAVSSFFTSFLPDTEAIRCNPSFVQSVLGSVTLSGNVSAEVFGNVVRSEFQAIRNTLMKQVKELHHTINDQLQDFLSLYYQRLGFQIAVIVTAFLGAIGTVWIVQMQLDLDAEKDVMEGDFECVGPRVRIVTETLRTVEALLCRIGLLQSVDFQQFHVSKTKQIEMSLSRAVNPLQLLRPFVPAFMFMAGIKNSGLLGAEAETNQMQTSFSGGQVELLNLFTGLKKGAVTVLYIGLKYFSSEEFLSRVKDSVEEDGSLSVDGVKDFNELLSIVHRCTTHFRGTVIQICSDAIVCVFVRVTINEDEEDERLEDGEILATHAAFAIKELCEHRPDGSRPVPFSAAIVSGLGLHGVVEFHVSKHYGLLSDALTTATAIEPLNAIHSSCIMTNSKTNDLLNDRFLTRPVHYHAKEGATYAILLEDPSETAPNREEIIQAQEKKRQKVQLWMGPWSKYEAVMHCERPTFEQLEEAYHDMEGYRVFHMFADEVDVAHNLATANLKKLAHHMGLSFSAAAEED